MQNVFKQWCFMERVQNRRVCFKSSSSSTVPETQAQKDHAEVAAERFNDYITRYVPFENAYFADITGGKVVDGVWQDDGSTAIKQDIVAGRVNADIAAKNNGGVPAGAINKIGSAVASDFTPNAAAAGASAITTARGRVEDARIQGMGNVVNIGSGQAASAIDGMGRIAANSAGLAESQAEDDFNRSSATQSAIMSGVGASAAAAGEYWKPGK